MAGQRKTDTVAWRLVSILIPLIFIVGGFVVMVQIMEYRVGELEKKVQYISGNPHGVNVQKIVSNQIEKYKILYDEKFYQNDKFHVDIKLELREIRNDLDKIKYRIYSRPVK